MVYFILKDCPKIYIIDEFKTDLNELFENKVKVFSKIDTFKVKTDEFRVTHLRLYSGEENRHQIHYCAHNREVKHENLSNYIPDLIKKIKDEDEKPFTYVSYISSDYLDSRVNNERTDFNLPENGYQLYHDEISKQELIKNIIECTRKHLEIFLEKVKDEKTTQLQEFIRTKAPQYRPLLKCQDDYIDNIPPDLSDEKLDLELHKIITKIELQLKEKSSQILQTDMTKIQDLEKYKSEYKKFIEEINELGKSRLAQYIVHRKLILELLMKTLQLSEETHKYSLEENIHEIIFPLRTTSEDIDYERQNLWIIDEKLSYHKYLASDVPLNSLDNFILNGSQRPDIIIFNEPFAFVEDNPPFSSIVIIEFKRPVRTNYSEENIDNPVVQIYNYVRKIKEGNVLDKNGRPISIKDNTPFYGYIICDLTNKLKEIAENYGLILTPDSLGYFGYNKNLTTYLEIISFDKLVGDARKRNQILFDKLNLPR